jgi:hypothetical protein
MGAWRSARIAISPVALHTAANSISFHPIRRWRLTMRELSAESRLDLYARSLSERTARRLHAAALYGAFAVIAAVVFGTLSYHPF